MLNIFTYLPFNLIILLWAEAYYVYINLLLTNEGILQPELLAYHLYHYILPSNKH